MKKNAPISTVLTTNCTIVESVANIQTIKEIFDYFPNRFLPVVDGLRFVGVILREEFLRKFLTDNEGNLTAKNLISKEMVKLSPNNTLADAKEIFDIKLYNVIPVTDDEDDLIGVILREDVEEQFSLIVREDASSLGRGLRKIMAFLSL